MMVCNHCNTAVPDGTAICPCCHATVTTPPMKESQLPAKYRPLGAWAYFGYNLLFSIPVLGFILLVVFSFSKGNINRRNYARSYWCGLLIVLLLATAGLLLGFLAGDPIAGLEELVRIASSNG